MTNLLMYEEVGESITHQMSKLLSANNPTR